MSNECWGDWASPGAIRKATGLFNESSSPKLCPFTAELLYESEKLSKAGAGLNMCSTSHISLADYPEQPEAWQSSLL